MKIYIRIYVCFLCLPDEKGVRIYREKRHHLPRGRQQDAPDDRVFRDVIDKWFVDLDEKKMGAGVNKRGRQAFNAFCALPIAPSIAHSRLFEKFCICNFLLFVETDAGDNINDALGAESVLKICPPCIEAERESADLCLLYYG